MIHFFYSNRQETLFEVLNNHIRMKQPAETFEFGKHLILTQNSGMQRWLTLRFSEENGISSGIDFDFPIGFLWRLFKKVTAFQQDDLIASRKEYLQIRLFDLLQENQSLEVVRRYVESKTLSDANRKLWDLSAVLASLFDEYEVFRTSRLRDHIEVQAEQNDWQFVLLDQLMREKGDLIFRHETQLQLSELLRQGSASIGYSGIHVYGVPTLPEEALRALLLLGKQEKTTVYWYQLVPTKHNDWSFLEPTEEKNESQLHDFLEKLGLEGRELAWLTQQLVQQEDLNAKYNYEFTDILPSSMLSCYQQALLENSPVITEQKLPNDTSIVMHSSYSPQREVELLRDELIKLFEDNPDLNPGEVLVMSSDIDTYAPHIEYYFNEKIGNADSIPFSIADARFTAENDPLQTLQHAFSLLQSNGKRNDILEFFHRDPVRNKLELNDTLLSKFRSWFGQTHTLQGWEKEIPEPGWGDFSLEKARELLFKSLFLYPDDTQLVDNQLISFSLATQEDVDVFVVFDKAIQQLEQFRHRIQKEKLITEWLTLTLDLIETFIQQDEHQSLTKIISSIIPIAEAAKQKTPLSLDLFLRFLDLHTQSTSAGSGFLQGKVTCCAMVPLRSLPFSVICVLGINEGAFPGKKIRSSFDWIEQEPYPGDRDRKKDDEYLFLESILSARKQLYISYVGRSMKDDSEYPKNALLVQFAESVKTLTGCEIPEIKHPLYAFNPSYFEKGKISYNTTAYQLLKQSTVAVLEKDVAEIRLTSNETRSDKWELKQWLRFLEFPISYLVHHELGVQPYRIQQDERDEELYNRNGLEQWQFNDELYQLLLTHDDLSATQLLNLIREKGLLKAGYDTEDDFFTHYEIMKERIAEQKKLFQTGTFPEITVLNWTGNGIHIQDSLRYDYSDKLVINLFSKLDSSKHILKSYVTGLFVAQCVNKSIQLYVFDKENDIYLFECNPNTPLFTTLVDMTLQRFNQPPLFHCKLSGIISSALQKDKGLKEWIYAYEPHQQSLFSETEQMSLVQFGKGTNWEQTDAWLSLTAFIEQLPDVKRSKI